MITLGDVVFYSLRKEDLGKILFQRQNNTKENKSQSLQRTEPRFMQLNS